VVEFRSVDRLAADSDAIVGVSRCGALHAKAAASDPLGWCQWKSYFSVVLVGGRAAVGE
jgi:hypothetical protein